MVGSSLTYGTHWMIYEYFKRHLTPMVHGNESLIPFVYMASASMGRKYWITLIGLAQLLSSAIRSPFEVIKQHLQVGIFYNTKFAIKSIYRVGLTDSLILDSLEESKPSMLDM